MPVMINAAQLDKFRKSQKNVTILDASWYLEKDGRDPKDEFLKQHVAGARFLDLTDFHDKHADLPNMLLRDEKKISKLIGALGIMNDHRIIVYDQSFLFTSFRAAWMFEVFGHSTDQIYILDGGFAAWNKYGGKIETGDARLPTPKTYEVNFRAQLIRTLTQMKMNLHQKNEQVIDVRHPIRYAGGAESRPELRSGHIPGSFSFPYFTMFENDGRLKLITKIRNQLTSIGVDLSLPIITTCGSGITSAILNVVLELMNHTENSLYDGSWSEWGSTKLYPGETNLDERPVVTCLE